MLKFLSTYAHALVSIAVTLIGILLGAQYWPGVVITVGWIFREVTQAEYRWIAKYGDGRRANMPWWGGFDPRAWKYDAAIVDMLIPAVAVGVTYWLVVLRIG